MSMEASSLISENNLDETNRNGIVRTSDLMPFLNEIKMDLHQEAHFFDFSLQIISGLLPDLHLP